MEGTTQLDHLERRIARLERRNRWMTAACVLLSAVALTAFARGHEQVVRAEKFQLVNARDEVVSEWSVGSSGPLLQLGRLYEPHVRLGYYGLGSSPNPGLQVVGDRGQLRINLGLERDVDATALFMYGPEPAGSGVSSGITLMHAPRFGPTILMQEQNRIVLRVPERGP